MPRLRIALLWGAALSIGGCADLSDLTGSRQAEENIAARCRNWDAMARAAAYPDAATIARHDQLAEKAADLEAAAVAQQLHGAALETAAEVIAQAKIEADDVYDAHRKYQVAQQCWENLGLVEQQHGEMRQHLNAATDSSPPTFVPSPRFESDPSLFQPPSPPPASPPPPDLYAVQHGDIRLFSPDGPAIGQTTQIGPTPAPTIVLVPVP
jgi:hypothetical protein